jgi:hypothetical protein
MEVLDEPMAHGMPPVLQLSNSEIIVYSTMAIGFLGDQLTTRMALNMPWIVEANSFVTWLMTRGLWLPLDLLMVAMSVSAHLIIRRAFKMEGSWLTLSPPLIYGLVKLSTALWNLLLIFG